MKTIEYKEVELQRELKLVATSTRSLKNKDIKTALNILNKNGRKYLKLRSNIRGTGLVSGNSLEINLTIPLDVRYESRNSQNADSFNNAWAAEFAERLGVYQGGYVGLEPVI